MNQAAHAHGPAVPGSAISAPITRSREPASVTGDHPAILDGIEAVVFDFDGTLADTTPSHQQALRDVLRHHGLDLDPDWYSRHAGLSIRDLLAKLPGGRHLRHDEIIQASRARLLTAIHCIIPIGSVVTLLRAARRAGLPCAIASGASRLLVQPGLEALGLTSEFAVVVTEEDVRHGKPARDLFIEAARRLDVPPSRCLAIDDAPDGVTAARAAGMHVLTVREGHLALADGGGEPPGQAHRYGEPEATASQGGRQPSAPDLMS
jgi:beta-phosphoglucomutase-like phosphatase (HAD superfamily)